MEFNTEIRKKQLENLAQFISTSRDKVEAILSSLNWSVEEVTKEKSEVSCPFDENHKLPPQSLEKHISKCSLRKENYDLNEEYLSAPNKQAGQSILIDNEKKRDIFSKAETRDANFKRAWNCEDADPKTSNRLLCTFSPDERLNLYQYAVKSTTGPAPLPEFNITAPVKLPNKELSNEELMALERDAKRRRIKYKSVYTNHKSHCEVMREVIDTQMELYESWVKSNSKGDEKAQNCKNSEQKPASPTSSHASLEKEKETNDRSTISRNSTRSSSSKSTNRKTESSKRDRSSDDKRSKADCDNRDYRRDRRDKVDKTDKADKRRRRSRSRESDSRSRRRERDREEYNRRRPRNDYKRNGYRSHRR